MPQAAVFGGGGSVQVASAVAWQSCCERDARDKLASASHKRVFDILRTCMQHLPVRFV
jgi:hypothetical protein